MTSLTRPKALPKYPQAPGSTRPNTHLHDKPDKTKNVAKVPAGQWINATEKHIYITSLTKPKALPKYPQAPGSTRPEQPHDKPDKTKDVAKVPAGPWINATGTNT